MKKNIFSDLSKSEKLFLEKNSMKIEISKNSILHSTDEEIKCVSLVLKGKLKVVKFSSDGNQQVVKYVGKNETFAEGFIFSGKKYPAYIMAENNSLILEIPRHIILKLFENKKFMISYIKEISDKMLNLSNIIEILSMKSIEERLLMYFSIIAKEQKSNIIYFKSKQKIADDIGSVREVVSKKMKILEQKKIIKFIDRNHFEILSLKYFY
jgi:CRP/FNR family transcriptional regulator